jgi:hypothetical protein
MPDVVAQAAVIWRGHYLVNERDQTNNRRLSAVPETLEETGLPESTIGMILKIMYFVGTFMAATLPRPGPAVQRDLHGHRSLGRSIVHVKRSLGYGV